MKNGVSKGKQLFKCKQCGRQFIVKTNKDALRIRLWKDYVWKKQTLAQLAKREHKSIKWVQAQLKLAQPSSPLAIPQSIIAVADVTFFGRGYGILVVRCPRLKQNLHFHEVSSESPAEYQKARSVLEEQGYVIEAAVLDGKRGVAGVFSDIPVQLCQFHQIAIIRRYLTSRPKIEAGIELRAITLALPTLTEQTLTELLELWLQRWNEFLKEKTYAEDTVHWQYTHRRIRSAYRSLITNLPYLFTYQKYPHLRIPNTTNSIDGYFSKLKQLLNVHRGMKPMQRYKLIQEILANIS